ncbi:MAG: ABC-2 family transporter protein [Bryobacteraceae bacterium]|nr:ABC-2 family transporter protein [Bryobacteraceae bacterium]
MRPAALLEFSRIGFMNMLAFRLRYYTGVITYLINVTVYYFIWQAIYAAEPDYAGLTFPQMVTYVAIGWIIRSMYFNNIDSQMASDILEGKISMIMLKPVSVQWSYIARAVGESAFRLLLLTAPTALVIAAIFPVEPPASAAHFGAFLLALAASIFLVASMNFIVGSCAVSLKSILGLLRAKFWMQELLSGLLVPVTVFPSPLREISGLLPFQHIGFTPMMIYLGKLSWPEIGKAFALEWFWVVFLIGFGAWFWALLSRRITIHGG